MIVLVVVFVSIGLLGWYQGRILPVLGSVVTIPIIEKPAPVVFSNMKKSMADLETARYQFDVDFISVAVRAPERITVQNVFEGKISPQLLGQLNVKMTFTLSDLRYLANADFRFTQDTSYVTLTEVPALSFINMAAVTGQWFSFNSADVSGRDTSMWQKIGETATDAELIRSYRRLPDSTVDGKPAYHYEVGLDKEIYSKSINRLSAALWPGGSPEALRNYLSSQENIHADITIGKRDFLLYSVSLHSQGPIAGIDASLAVSNFNQEVAVEQPATPTPISSFPKLLFNETNWLDLPLFGYQIGIDLSAQTTDEDQDGLYGIWESAFSTDPNNPDTDGDGYSDGMEVRSGYNPLSAGKLMANW